ncbi:MAG: hypothetical protein WCW31_01455 [Patescibacteria group bacterium]|jgi:hypothetical protein
MKNRTLISLIGSIAFLPIGVVACSSDTSSGKQPANIPADSGLDTNSQADSNPAETGPADVLLDESSSKDSTTADSDSEDSGPTDSAPSDASQTDVSNEVVEEASICPSCDDLLTWDTDKPDNSTFGVLSTGSPVSDTYAIQILSTCTGWDYFEGHKGGTGDTLEITSCNKGIVLIWAYNMFMRIQLSQGWTGTTSEKIAIGSTYQDFIQAYPGCLAYPSDASPQDVQVAGCSNGTAFFTNGLLVSLRNIY